MSSQSLGFLGESIATSYLTNLGFLILARNFRTKIGELDIVAEKNNTLFFCEVKTRVGDLHGKPFEAVTYRKIEHIKRTAQAYLLQNSIKNSKLSIQVISIELFPTKKVKYIKMYEIV